MPNAVQNPEQVEANASSSDRLFAIAMGASAVVVLVGLFLFLFFNRFAGLCSGSGEYAGGVAFLHGIMPYRDYFGPGPPLNLFKSAILLKLFGQALIVSRLAGVLERLLIGAILFVWLSDLFAPWQAVIAGAATLILSSGDHADPIASYNHDAILFAILCGFSARLIVKYPGRTLPLATLSGAFAAGSFLTKQTVGLGALFGIGALALFLLWRSGHSRRAVTQFAIGYISGAAIPLLFVAAYLARVHLLNAWIQMVFVTGPAAKAARPADFFIRYLLISLTYPLSVLFGLIGTALTWKTIRRGIRAEQPISSALTPILWCLAVGISVIAAAKLMPIHAPLLGDFSKGGVYFVFFGITALLCTEMISAFRRPVDRRVADCLLLAGVGWICAATLCLSWPAFEAMELPGFAIIAAAVLAGSRPSSRWLPLTTIAVLVFFQTEAKLEFPFDFAYQSEAPVQSARSISSAPQLAGMRMPEPTVQLIDDTLSAVHEHTTPSDRMFTYPEMAVLYALSNRYPPTRAISQNIDVLNDSLARGEANLLLKNPPAVIVYARPTDQQVRQLEAIWRSGKPSGQREIVAALDSLVSHYDLAGTYVLRAGDTPIRLYVRHAR